MDGPMQIERYIVAMATGDKEAVAGLYEETKTAVYGFSLSILKNRQDAEDVLQDTYIRIFYAANQYKANGNPMPWVLTIAKNLSLMRIRERHRVQELPDEEWHALPFEEPTVTSEDKWLLSQVMGALTDEERQIVLLHAVTECKHREIAEMLKMPLSTVLSKYRRAIKKMKNCYEEGNRNVK